MKKKLSDYRKLLIFGTLIIVPFFIWGFFFFNSGEEKDLEIDALIEDEKEYPLFVAEDGFSPEINTEAAFAIFYGDDGLEKILYEQNAETALPIASISKLMTALIVLENYNLEEEMGVSEWEVTSKTEFRDFRAWKDTKIMDMLYPMLIESNNSAAFAFALISQRYIEGGNDPIDLFVNKMNSRAQEIGLLKTKFINPSGLDGRDDYNLSTAKEISLLSYYIYENNPLIFEILKLPNYRLYSSDRMVYYEAVNTNALLHRVENEWQKDILGGKTGWTHAAYGCLVLLTQSPEENGIIVTVVLGAEDRFLETKKMLDYIHTAYEF